MANGETRVHFTVRLLPSSIAELRRRAHERLGAPSLVGRLIEESFMPSPRYQPTPEQAEDPALHRAWFAGATQEEALQVAYEELCDLRARLRDFEGTVSE